MKKLGRIKLNELPSEFNTIDDSELAKMLGGGTYDYHEGETYYDLGEYTSMLADGTWAGGNVTNMGYVDSTGVGNDAGVSDSIGVSDSVGISDYVTVDNNADALLHYFHGGGEAVDIGDNSTLAALSNEDFLNAHETINSGGNFENNQFGIDMTEEESIQIAIYTNLVFVSRKLSISS